MEYKNPEVNKLIYSLAPDIMLHVNNIVLGNNEIDNLKNKIACKRINGESALSINTICAEIKERCDSIKRDYDILQSKGVFLGVDIDRIR